MEYLVCSLIVGVGATALTDLWTLLRRRAFGIALPDYALVGRWFAHMARGRFRHAAIGKAAVVRGERWLGWAAHYAIGVAFAALLLLACGVEWAGRPTLVPALLVGFGTVLAPFLVMQPAMGAGVFACRTPRPSSARLQSVVTHGVFGFGLYAAAWLARPGFPW